MDGGAWWAAVHGVAKSRTRLSDFTFTFHFHALVKEMATHSSVLAWRIPGTGEPGGLPSLGSHRVRHEWSDLVAADHFLRLNFLGHATQNVILDQQQGHVGACYTYRIWSPSPNFWTTTYILATSLGDLCTHKGLRSNTLKHIYTL